MTLGPTTFAIVTWGSVALVSLVFLYVATVALREAIERRESGPGEGIRR